MADGNIVSSTIPDMFTKVRGEVAESRGDVTLIRASGEEVPAEKGAKIYLNDVIISHDDSAVVVFMGDGSGLTLGQNQQLPFTQPFFDRLADKEEEGSLDEAISVEALEQAIAEGQSLEELLQAPAAGGAPGEEEGGSSSVTFYQRTGDVLLPVSGFETSTFSSANQLTTNEEGDLDSNNQLNGVNRPPVANPSSASADENTIINGNVSATDDDGTVVGYSLVTPPSAGTLTFNSDGSYSFDPGTDFDSLPVGASQELTFTYTATDDDGNVSAPATVTLTILGTNDDPVAVDDVASTQEDTPLTSTVDLDANDTDLDGDALSVVPGTFTTAGGGSIVIAADGSYTYTPAANFNGTDTVTYTVVDGNGGSDTASLSISVSPVNDAPVANDDAISATEDTPFTSTVDLDANDFDVDGDALSVVAGTYPTAAGGSIVISADGSYTYTPPLNYIGSDSVAYTVTDGALSDSGTLNITVNPVNDAPVAVDDAITVAEDTPFTSTVDLDANDTDLDGDALSVVPGTFVTTGGGSITIAADGSYTYTPAPNFNGTDTVDYTVTDGALTDTGTLTITVTPVNDAPVAVDDAITVAEDTPFTSTVDLDANDTDLDGDALSVVPGTFATTGGGSITIAADGSYTYTPGPNFNGTDTVDYTVTDGALTDTGTLTITVTPVNDAPVAVDDAITVAEDTPFTSTIDLDANDTDLDGDALSVVPGTFATTGGGSITIAADGSYTYTPAPNFNGTDTVDYTVTDGALTDTGTLTITVTPVNDAPVAVDDAITVAEDTPFTSTVDLDANDTDLDGDALSVVPGTFATTGGGSITIAADGSYTYTPAPNFNGTDTVDYTVTDGALTDTGTLTITVTPVNDAPVAVDDAITVAEDTPFTSTVDLDVNDTDLDGDALSVVPGTFTTTGGGSITIAADGSYTYTPAPNFNGTDTVDYTVTDGALTDTGTLTMTVTPVNDAPVAVDDAITVAEDTPFTSTVDLDANDTDLDGDALSVVPGTFATTGGGSITIAADGSYTYTPAPNFNGTDTVDYTVTDGALTDTGTLTITVTPVNDAPVAVDDAITVAEDTPFTSTVDLDANDTDLDGDALSVVPGTFATTGGGSITIAADGSYTYTPAPNFNGTDTVDYTVTDGALTDTGTLTITVTPVNDAPVNTVPGAQTVDEDTALSFTGPNTISVTDVDGNLASTQLTVANGALSVTLSGAAVISAGANGSDTLTISGSEADINATLSSLNYQGDFNFNGSDTLTVLSTDSAGVPLTDTDTVAIEVTPVLDIGYVRITQSAPTVGESGTVTYTVEIMDGPGPTASPLVVPPGEMVTVSLSYGGTATPDTAPSGVDYTVSGASLPDQVQIVAGSSSTTFTVTAIDDIVDEGNETIQVNITSVINDSGAIEAFGPHPENQVTTTIIDNDTVGVASVSSDEALEGDSLVHSVTLSAASLVDETFDFTITPTHPDFILSDYGSITFSDGVTLSVTSTAPDGTLIGTITVPAGVTSFTVSIPASDDTFNELVETYSLAIDSVTGTGTIIDTDLPTVVDDGATVYESGLPGGNEAGNPAAPTTVSGNVLSNDSDFTDIDVIVDVNGVTPDANGVITLTSTTSDGAGGTIDLGTLTLYTADFGGNVAGDYTYTLLNPTLANDGGSSIDDIFTYTVQSDVDGSGNVNTISADLAITIADDYPEPVADVVTTDEDTTASGNLLDNDANGITGVTGFTVAGDATLYGPGSVATITGVGTLQIDGDGTYTFIPASDYFGPVPTATYTTNIGSSATLDISVTPVNDAPVNTVPGAQSVLEDTSLSFTGPNTISVTDVDGNLASTQLSVVNGTLLVTLSGAATITAGANGSGTLTISGSEADINDTLASVSYQGNLDYSGSDTLTIVSTDSDAVPLSDTDTIGITVTPNMPPVITTTDGSVVESTTVLDQEFSGPDIPLTPGTGPGDANGTDPTNLTLERPSNITLTFVEENAGFSNSIGYYLIDESGNISSANILWADTNNVSGSPPPFNDIPAGEISFFLIQNGYSNNPTEIDAAMSGTGFVRFEDLAGNPLTSSDTGSVLVYYSAGTEDSPAGTRTVLSDTFHSTYGNLNPDGVPHTRSGIDAGNENVLTIGFEDLPLGGSDWDLQDFVFTVEINSVTYSVSDIDAGITLADDGPQLVSASVAIVTGRTSDELVMTDATEALADSYGISYDYDADTHTLSLSGTADVSQYQEILAAVQLGSPGPLGSDPREIEFTATDTDGLTSMIATVNLDADASHTFDGNDFIAGGVGDDTLLAGDGDDIVFGKAGSDTLTGNGGTDTFLWVAGDADGSTDIVTDFTAGPGGEVLDFSDLLSGESATAASLDDYLTITSDGTDTTIEIDDNGAVAGGGSNTVVLEGVDLASLAGSSDNQVMIDYLLTNNNINVDL